MEYINFGKVENVSASVPVAANDTVYHIIIDFVPNCPEIFDTFHTDMGKILEWPDDYVLCNVSDIKELEDLGADLNEHIKNLERIKEFLINGNTTLIDENSKLKATNQALKDQIKELVAQATQMAEYTKLQEEYTKLEDELAKIKTTRTLREAYITGIEKGCESLKEDRDLWKRRWNSVVTDIAKSLEANGIEFTLKEVHGNGNWDVVIDIPELNEAKKKVEDLEKKLKAAKSNETYWRDRKEEEEEYHHYWLHTYDRVVKQAADKGIHIGVCGNDEDCNAGIVVVDNAKAEELKKQVVQMEDVNKKLKEKLGAADNALEYWNNTYNDIVIAGKKVGVEIDIKGKKSDVNAGFVYVTNEKAKDLESQVKAATFANDTLDSFSSVLTNDYNSLKAEKERLYNQNQTLGFELSKQRSATDYWRNTYYEVVEKVHDAGVSVDYVGCDSDNNCALLHITNHNNKK